LTQPDSNDSKGRFPEIALAAPVPSAYANKLTVLRVATNQDERILMRAIPTWRILRSILLSTASVGLVSYLLLKNRTVAFTAEAYVLIIWIGLAIAIWWCDGHRAPEYRQRVWRNVVICTLFTYLSCVLGYVVATVLTIDEFASGRIPSLPSIVWSGIILPIHLIAIVPAALSGFIVAQTADGVE
jgi:hypothetical protein